MRPCESCGQNNARDAEFCTNPACEAYLGWQTRAEEPLAELGDPARLSGVGPRPLDKSTQVGEVVESTIREPKVVVAVPKRPPLAYVMERQRQDPVAVRAVQQPEPTAPLLQSAADGTQALLLHLEVDRLDVMPGSQAWASATVINKGSIVDSVQVAVLGLPAGWVTIEPEKMNLYTAQEGSLRIGVAPPADPSTRPGTIDAEVAVWSGTNPKVRCGQRLSVRVGAFQEFESRVDPVVRAARFRTRVQVHVANRGNRPVTAAVSALQPESKVKVGGGTTVKLEPGARTTVELVLTVRRPALTGPTSAHTIEITVRPEEALPQQRTLTLQQVPILSKWAARLLAGAILLLIAGIAFLVDQQRANRLYTVPAVVGQPSSVAADALKKAQFDIAPTQVPFNATPGEVVGQSPPAGTRHHHHTLIVLSVSSGVRVPDVSNKPLAQAEDTLTSDGLTFTVVTAPAPDPAGTVTAESPSADSMVPPGQSIKLTVSAGLKVINIVGLHEQDASAELQAQHLIYQNGGQAVTSDPAKVGLIIAQSPPAGTAVAANTEISGIVGQAPPPGVSP